MRTCSVAGCDRKHKGHGLCGTHLARWRATGITPSEPIRGWARLAATCKVEGCERKPTARGWCQGHYVAWWKHGDPLSNLQRVEVPTYVGMHDRLGKLKTGRCSTPGCENTRTEMALIEGRGLFFDEGRQRFYSNRAEDYAELCTTCHKQYDGIVANLGVTPKHHDTPRSLARQTS